MELYRSGKVKKVWIVDEKEFEFEFTDNISVFDKVIPTQIPHKGESLNRTATYWFERCEDLGIKTHYLSTPSATRMRVKRVRVIPDYSKLDTGTTNYLIPLEVIARYYVAGSFLDRLKKNPGMAEEYGIDEIRYGVKLKEPLVEFTTKLEEHDRLITEDEAKKIAGLRDSELEEITEAVLRIDGHINGEVEKRGLIHVDGKKEFAFDENRELMIVDTFATADEDRWWDAGEYSRGNLRELSKEFVRRYYRESGYHEKLMEAREKGLPEPEIPPLPEDVAARVSEIYINMYERLTGQKW